MLQCINAAFRVGVPLLILRVSCTILLTLWMFGFAVSHTEHPIVKQRNNHFLPPTQYIPYDVCTVIKREKHFSLLVTDTTRQ